MTAKESLQVEFGTKSEAELLGLLVMELGECEVYKSKGKCRVFVAYGCGREFKVEANTALEAFVEAMVL
jgi:hypothetical protein